MNPSIEAAWIAAGSGLFGVAIGVTGTAIVALAGFRSTRRATADTLAASSTDIRAQIEASSASLREQIEADRRSRFWEKRAAAYEAILAALRHRASIRHFQLDMFQLSEQANEKALADISEREPPGWYETVGRLLAYGSDDALTAFEAAQDADRLAAKGYLTWKILGEQHEAMFEALKVAEQKDEALLQLIRRELRSRPDLDSEAT